MFTSINPATGEEGARFEAMDDAGIEAALVRAHAAFRSWRVSDIVQRTTLLTAIADQF